jgi:proteasome accessory factor C
VRLVLAPDARWIAEYYAVTEIRETGDGALEAVPPAKELGWVARLLLRVEPDVTVVSPPELAESVRDLARRTLDRYGE